MSVRQPQNTAHSTSVISIQMLSIVVIPLLRKREKEKESVCGFLFVFLLLPCSFTVSCYSGFLEFKEDWWQGVCLGRRILGSVTSTRWLSLRECLMCLFTVPPDVELECPRIPPSHMLLHLKYLGTTLICLFVLCLQKKH